MKDGSDAVGDWAILNALINTAAGGSWISFHHGGGVGMGYSLHAGMVVVADGTDLAGNAWKECSQPTLGWASSATSTQAMTSPRKQQKSTTSTFR